MIRTENGKASVLRSGLIFTTVTQLTAGLVPQFKEHSKTIREIIQGYGVTHLIVERYMSRRMGGVTIEAVNVMIGGLLEICTSENVYFRCISSAQWKNAANRSKEGFLEEEYRIGQDEKTIRKGTKITPHTIDATMIGLFAIGLMTGDRPYPTEKMRSGIIVSMVRNSFRADFGELIKPIKKKKKVKRVRK